ncbi:MAG: pentapeptide repeat-containing protein [Cyanobacteriota bacterium]
MINSTINQDLTQYIIDNNYIEFNKRFDPELAGILSNGEAVIIYKEKDKVNLSSYQKPLDATNKDLTKFKLNNCNLTYSKFNNSICSNMDLSNCNLDFSNFKNADLTNTSMSGSSLIYTNLANAKLTNINLNHSDLIHTNFVKKIIIKASDKKEEVEYEGNNLSNMKAIESFISGIDFIQCNLMNANFTGSILKNSTFINSFWLNTVLNSCKFQDVLFKNNNNIENCQFENSNIQKIKVKNTTFVNCSFSGSLFFELDLIETKFINCNFYKAQFINSELSRNSAKFNNCNFYNAKFFRSSVSFDRSKFNECNFNDVVIEDCEVFVADKSKPKAFMPDKIHLLSPKFDSIDILEERLNKISNAQKRKLNPFVQS